MAAGRGKYRSAIFWLHVSLLALLVDYLATSERYNVRELNTPRVVCDGHLFSLHVPVDSRWPANLKFKSRAKRFLSCRVQYTAKGTSSFHLQRDLLSCGDISANPGPRKTKSAPKYPCNECQRTVRNNQDAILCSGCNKWSHAKCLGMSRTTFRYYLDKPDLEWTCATCALPPLGDSFFAEDSIQESLITTVESEVSQSTQKNQERSDDTVTDNAQLESLRKHANKDILMCHLNINSIQNKFEELAATIKKIGAHIAFISETKIDASYPDAQFSIPGYTLYRNDRKKGGGGIMALVSSSLTKKRLKPIKHYKTLELIALEVKTDAGNMVILGIYRPPRAMCSDYRLLLEYELSDVCNWANLQSNSVVVTGDLNLDRLRPDKAEGKVLLDLENEQGFECLITKPTRVEMRGTKVTKTLIDVLLSNKPELFKYSGNYYPSLSDHALIYGVLKERVNPNKPKVITFRGYKNFQADVFKQHLATAPWHIAQLFDEVDDQVHAWNLLMNDILDELAPVKSMRVRDNDVPYMTSEWKSAIRAKRKATSKYLKNKTQENWELRRKARNEATKQRRNAIKDYWRKKAEDLKTKPRDFFKTFKPFLSTKDCSRNAEIQLNVNGNIVKDQKQVAEVLVDHFATIADGIGGNSAQLKSMDDFKNHPSIQKIKQESENWTQTLDVKPVTQGQVLAVLESLNANKATGCDAIPAKVMKIGAKELSQPLTTLFNSCIHNRVWPSDWKRGDWTPVYKKDDKYSKENYRPITVLPCVDKVFEQLVGAQVSAGFEGRMYEHSSAYRKAHSCETTLINLVEGWRKARDNKLAVSILATDMSKAFDSLHPPLLLSKLRAYGFQESAVQLLNSYLCDRKYRVKLGSHVSSCRTVSRGCPQGSALGPLLWNIFQNDLSYCVTTNLSMYADDHQMYHTGSDQSSVTSKLRDSTRTATKWYDSNLLAGNLKKYQTMNIGYNQDINNAAHAICVNNEEIKTVENIKLLGVTIDSKLNFTDHISSICKKASQRIGVLMRLRNLIPTKAKLVLFKSAVLPYLTYCHVVWHFCRSSDVRKLERLQERGLRAVYRDKDATYSQLLKRAYLPTLSNRRLQDICILMYKVKHKLCPTYICNIFNNHNSSYFLRQSDFSISSYNSVTYGKHSLRYLGPRLWGKLSADVRRAKTLDSFKNKIRGCDVSSLVDDGCTGCSLCFS